MRSSDTTLQQPAHACDSGTSWQDDDDAVDFVTAASNLRAEAYGIPQQSLFAAKACGAAAVVSIEKSSKWKYVFPTVWTIPVCHDESSWSL
jgi:hypothetical protein